MASPDKAKLLGQTLDRLRTKLKPASIPASDDPSSTPNGESAPPPADAAGPDIFHGDAVLREFVRSFLIWESTTAKADTALKKIASGVVDINEFRVCLPSEMAAIIGHTYPKVEDRVVALRSSLTQIFKRENRLRLAHLPGLSKKAATAYLATLTHTPAFVTDRVALLCCGIHAVPVDSRIAAILEKAKVIDKTTTAEEAAGATARLIKAGDARDAYGLLQAAADQAPVTATRVPKAAPSKSASPVKKTTPRSAPRKSK